MRVNYEIGERVWCAAVGMRAAFEGEIVKRVPGGYHVMDDEGREWNRSYSQLKRPKVKSDA